MIDLYLLDVIMKKLTLIVAMSSVLALTACSKEVTEVQKGTTVEVKAKSAALTNNNVADIKADMEKIQTLALAQESKAAGLDQRLNQALQSENEDEIKKLFPEFKAAMLSNLNELKKLKLNSGEVTQLRGLLNEMTNLGLDLQEELMNGENADPEKLQALQARAAQVQQDIIQLSQKIQMLTTPEANQMNINEAELAQQLADQINQSAAQAEPETKPAQ